MAESTTTSTPSQTTASTPTTTAPAPAPAPAVTTTAEPKGLLLKADAIANQFRAEVQSSLGRAERKPKLVGILATSSAPSKSYAEFTRRQCEELGFEFVLRKVGAALNSVGEGGGGGEVLGEGEGVEEAIVEANEDGSVDGIMVYFPIFGAQQDHYLQQIVSPLKDVEGLHFKFHYNLYHNIRFLDPKSLLTATPSTGTPLTSTSTDTDQPPAGMVKSIIPCTPLAIVKCLEYVGVYNKILPYGDRAYGRTVTVINRSEVVGRPLAALLANDGARVLSVDIDSIQEYTKRPRVASNPASSSGEENVKARYHPRHVVHASGLSLRECLAVSDVVVSAVPSAGYKVKTEWLKDGCVCLNVAAEKNFEKDVRDKASIYVPAVGKVTILMLLRNL
ncbi:NAD(P)-binding protein [Macrolepiota fuliginosa MF-IS2]|uniref:NAD(P)-binding protein n=1 Tax=Macrolepiota fuliginosa MF-IS2 TaxID=1400762 RepID=A0A9P5X142_9AGAR|nr:NAD(P)-binding protein [Macrolepiota fuliginosa MF-IS2]